MPPVIPTIPGEPNDHPAELDNNPAYSDAVIRAATAIRSYVTIFRDIRTVLDVGSNIGQWSRAFAVLGCKVTAVDSPHIREALIQPPPEFIAADLREPLYIGRGFDLVLCLEVAEHLPEVCADVLVESLVRHGEVIAFSAATPGQGGHKHINEQPLVYWTAKFRAHGYAADDQVRLHLPSALPAYYRKNLVIFRGDR